MDAAEEGGGESATAATDQEAIGNGTTATATQPTVAIWIPGGGACSGVLIHKKWGLTARHCMTTDREWDGPLPASADPATGRVPIAANTFYTSRSFNVGTTFVAANWTNQIAFMYDFVPTAAEDAKGIHGIQDIALFSLTNEEQVSGVGKWAPLYSGYGQTNLDVTMYGYGLNTPTCPAPPLLCVFPKPSDGGVLRYSINTISHNYYTTLTIHPNSLNQWPLPGDSGGPSYVPTDFLGRTNWNVVGIHSISNKYVPDDSIDVHIDPFKSWIRRSVFTQGDVNGDHRADITLTGVSGWTTLPYGLSNTDGTFSFSSGTNPYLPNFAAAATTSGVKIVSGDFDGNGLGDVALTGPAGWTDIRVALSNGTSFTELDKPGGNFSVYASQDGAIAVPGDFNGDGRDDIALVGGKGWNTIPVAFQTVNNTWVVTNSNVADFPTYAQQAGAMPVAGDFDSDGRADIALVGGDSWDTVPFAFSDGQGTFTVRNISQATFAGYAKQANVYPVSGDFLGGGADSIALIGGANWTTIPILETHVAGSSFNLTVHNQTVASFPALSRTAGAKAVVGDFNGDRMDDIALVGVSGWNTVPIAKSRGDSNFDFTNNPSPAFVSAAAGFSSAKPVANHRPSF